MTFIELDLNAILNTLSRLNAEAKPLWGEMSAQRMVEHLTDTMSLAKGEISLPLEIPEDKTDRAKGFVMSEHPLPKDFQAGFAPKSMPLRNTDLPAAIAEFESAWKGYQSFFKENNELETLHPNFGNLDFEHWQRLNRKHLTHHFKQFDLL